MIVSFQHIEEAVKEHIARQYDQIRFFLDGRTPFKFTMKNLERLSMGSLADELSRVSDNDELVSALKDLAPTRNQVAHRYFLFIEKQQTTEEELKALLSDLGSASIRVDDCFQQLIMEVTNSALKIMSPKD